MKHRHPAMPLDAAAPCVIAIRLGVKTRAVVTAINRHRLRAWRIPDDDAELVSEAEVAAALRADARPVERQP